MASKKRNKLTKKKLKNIKTYTLDELYKSGDLPNNFHLSDRIDMKEYHKKHQNDWWLRMSKPYEK